MSFLTPFAVNAPKKTVLSISVLLASVFSVTGCKVNDVTQVVDEDVTEDIFVDTPVPGRQSDPAALVGAGLSSLQPAGDDRLDDMTVRNSALNAYHGVDDSNLLLNSDSSKLLLGSNKIMDVVDGSDIGSLWNLAGMQPLNNPVWSNQNPDIIFGTIGLKLISLNISTQEIKVIRDMGKLDGFVSTQGDIDMEGSQTISADDRYIALSDIARGGSKIVVVDISTGERRASLDDIYAHPDFRVIAFGSPEFTMDLGVSLSGEYVIIEGADGHHLFDASLSYIRKLAEHEDIEFALDTEGEDSIVSVCPAKMERLSDGKITSLSVGESGSCG
jgi:hypothetical protein